MADDLHGLVLLHGREKAREMVPESQRPLIDIAAEVMADEAQRIGITYAGFCLTALPHKRLPDDQVWMKRGHRVTLLVEPGRLTTARGAVPKLYGVPYGARARMILLYLQTQAVRTGSREVELGRSMRDWLGRMGLTVGGETARALREQAARMSACSLKFFWESDTSEGWDNGRFVRSGLRFRAADGDEGNQGSLWEDRVLLDEVFFRALREHPVPLREAAIRELRDRSMSLDLYVWLAYRLHTLDRATPISWAALREQFGAGFRHGFHFRREFRKSLAPAIAAYPEARVDVGDTGLVLHPSSPPVAALVRSGRSSVIS
jgi:Plasmid encoded RepA protein